MTKKFSLVAINFSSGAVFAQADIESWNVTDQDIQNVADVLGKIGGEKVTLEPSHRVNDSTYELYVAPRAEYSADDAEKVEEIGTQFGRYEYCASA